MCSVELRQCVIDRCHGGHACRYRYAQMDHWTVTMTSKGNFTSFTAKAIAMWNECKQRHTDAGRADAEVWERCSEPGLQ